MSKKSTNALEAVKLDKERRRAILKVCASSGFSDFAVYQVFWDARSDYMNMGANTSATMVINFIRMFRDGPEVSLKGSPTVSPLTAAA